MAHPHSLGTPPPSVNGAVKAPVKKSSHIEIKRIYSKNHQFEIQGLPSPVMASGWQPTIDLQANPRYLEMEASHYEIVLALQLTIRSSDGLLINLYWEQAGLFTLENVSPEKVETVLYGLCPNMLFPYAGVMVNQQLSAAGLPPVYLAPLDFIQLYREHASQKLKPPYEKPLDSTVA